MVLAKAFKKIKLYGELVMFSHTIFSLSFAIISMVLASGGLPSLYTVFWIVVAFMGARTGANAINRVIDAKIDAINARTAQRHIPKGEVSIKEAVILTAISFVVMVIGAAKLNLLCLILSPIALVLLLGYSYTKRFTWLCHLILGITTAAAPVGAWIAVTGTVSLSALAMGAANVFWVAGFDIIYSSQDYEFDVEHSLYSIPVRFGVRNALRISSLFHVLSLIFLVFLGIINNLLGLWYFCGLLIVALLLFIEHSPSATRNSRSIKIAAYSINQLISIVLLVFSLIDIFSNVAFKVRIF